MSKPTFLHQVYQKSIVDDKITEHEESIIDGPKGLTFKMFHREGDNKEKIIGRREKDGKIKIKIMKDNDVSEKEMDLDEFKKFVKKEKSLAFTVDYVTGLKGGARHKKASTKRSSRKGTKRHSRKRVSRKASRPKTRSKKSSKKVSRRSRKHH